MEEKYDGMYLIRGSNNVESEKVSENSLYNKNLMHKTIGIIGMDKW